MEKFFDVRHGMGQATQLPGESSCGGAVSEGKSGGGTSAGQSREREKLPTAPSSSQPMQAQDMEQHEQQPKKPQPVAERLRERMGREGYEKAGATMLAQQDTLRQQVPIVIHTSSTSFIHSSCELLENVHYLRRTEKPGRPHKCMDMVCVCVWAYPDTAMRLRC